MRSLTLLLCMLSLALGVGMMVSQSWGARDALFWTETPPTQVPVV
jgi:hypothetical protein